jgi:Protein of unknown function (DUF2793)
MDQTPNLGLPYIMAAQAQKHVTHNEAIRHLDAIVQLGVLDRDLAAPPATPTDGTRYIVAANATGAWANQAGRIAAFQDGAWAFFPPVEGWLAWVADEDKLLAWDGTSWVVAGGGALSLNPVPLVGINTTADTTNRLSVKSPASLFDNAGAGHQIKTNKAAATDTASLLYQTAYSGRAEMGLTGDDDFHVKVSADGSTWREAMIVNRSTGSVSFPNSSLGSGSSTGTTSPIINANLRRVWAKAAAILTGEAGARLNLVTLGDSVAPMLRELIDARLKIELVNGGFAGRFSGENGFADDGNGTAITQMSSDFTISPNGTYWSLAPGGSKYFAVGNAGTPNINAMYRWHPSVFAAPANVTRIGIYYTRQPGGGVFKVQRSNKGSESAFTDVTGLTAIDTNGALAVQYLEVAITAAEVARLKIVHVSGGACAVLGGLAAADVGVISHSWQVGGLPLTAMITSPRFAELAAIVPADIVMAMFLDSPGDTASSTGKTVAQLINDVLNGIRTAFPSTIVPASTAPWAGKTALNARPPHFVWFGGNKVEAPGSVDQDAYNAAIRANAVTNGACFVDTAMLWGAWRDAWDMGVMSEGDGLAASTHPRTWFYGALVSTFLNETQLINGAFTRPLPQPRFDKVQVGSGTTLDVLPGRYNAKNRFKVGDDTTQFSAGPLDVLGFGDIAAGIRSAGTVYECGLFFQSVATNGRNYLITSQPGGGFQLRDMIDSKTFLQFNAALQLALGASSGVTVALGPKGQYFTGIRHGTVTLAAGVATVTDAAITANARITVTRRARGGTPTTGIYEAIPAAGSFTVTARDNADAVATADTSTLSYVVVEP